MATSPPGLLIPSNPLAPRQPDEHFAAEAEAAATLGLPVHLVDHDLIVSGDISAGLRRVMAADACLVYRGWMVSPARYREMAEALSDRGVDLRTSSEAFVGGHHLPRWYPGVAGLTPESVWTTAPDLDELMSVSDLLGGGPAVLKDYSKSEKHYWYEAMYVPESGDHGHLLAVATRFRELRGVWFDTGFVLRRFEAWAPGEWRTWWLDGRCVATTAHPDTPDQGAAVVDLSAVHTAVSSLGLPFISVDLATSSSTGDLRIIEVGDGQVSDRPFTSDPTQFLAAITGRRRPGQLRECRRTGPGEAPGNDDCPAWTVLPAHPLAGGAGA